MTWQDTLARLGDTAERRARNLLARYESGLIDRDTFVQLAAALVAREQGRAVSTADLAVAATVARQTGRPVSPAGLDLPADQRRIRDAVGTVLEDRPTTVPDEDLPRSRSDRLARLARAETLSAGQTATQAAWAAVTVRDGWVRQPDSDPCPLCLSWSDGVKRPWSVPMNRHPGCGCIPVPA